MLAIGKAARAMAAGAKAALPQARGLIVTTAQSNSSTPRDFELLEADHPVPRARSLGAGMRILESVQSLPPSHSVLCLLSGGASALAEVLIPSVTADELVTMTEVLLGSGLPIEVLNACRSTVSELKGGRLRALLGRRAIEALVVSDVSSDDPAIIASGPLDAAGEATRARLATLGRHPAFGRLPSSVREAIRTYEPLPPSSCPSKVVLSGRLVAEAVAEEGRLRGWSVAVTGPVEGEASERGRHLATCNLDVECTIMFGETTVTIDHGVTPGKGGRNQELALAFAAALPPHSSRVLLALATDGIDGQSSNAGAIVDAGTCGRDSGLDVAHCLSVHDAATFLEVSGDALQLSATGTNVADLTVILGS